MWYREFLGCRWVEGATGPKEFDCWGWVVFGLQQYFGVSDVPRCAHVNSGDHKAYTATAKALQQTGVWQQVSELSEGVVVLIGRKRCGVMLVQHIGLCINGQVSHCRMGAGVCIETVSKIKDLGYTEFEYWKHQSL